MVVKALQNAADPSRGEVGEIDTRAPFSSVRAAVSMFGVSSGSSPEKPTVTAKKPKLQSSESPLAKERQLHMALRELTKFKDQFNSCVTTRIQALNELELDRKTVDELQQKLKLLNESKETSRKVTADAKIQIRDLGDIISPGQLESTDSWKQELESAREQYAVAIGELDLVKQELRRVKRDLELCRDAKICAIQQEAEAKQLADINSQRANQLAEELASLQESIMHVKLASSHVNLEEPGILSDRDNERLSYKLALEETEQKLVFLKEQYDADLVADHEIQLEKITNEIDVVQKELEGAHSKDLQKELEKARASDLESVAVVSHMLEDAMSTLNMLMEEENSLRNLVDVINSEIENKKKFQLELKMREEEMQTRVSDLESKLKESTCKLESASAGELKMREAYNDLISTLGKLSLEAEHAKKNAELMRKNTKEMKKESEAAHVAVKETEKQLHISLAEAEKAKEAESNVLNQITVLSEKANHARSSTSESGARITISSEEFESLGRKVEEAEVFSGVKVTAALAQIEALKASEKEAIERMETLFKEIEAIELETEVVVKRAEISEAAMKAIEGEMRKLREVEQRKATEAAARSLADIEVRVQASPPKVRVPKPNTPTKLSGNRMTRENSHTTKRSFMPNFVGIFHKKKNQPDVGSPSYVSSEKPGLLGVLE